MINKRWDHPGKKEIDLKVKGISPVLRIVVNPDIDGSALAATLSVRLKECVAATIRETVNELLEYQDFALDIECAREEILLSTVEYQTQREANMQQLRELELIPSVKRDEHIENNPDNGKYGMWLVSGMRHFCVVNGVDTARDALDAANASGEVGSWEWPTAKYIDPAGPKVVSLY